MSPADATVGTTAVVSLGSNIEPRADFLRRALDALSALPGTRFVRASSVRETDPVGVPAEFAAMKFLNQVAVFETTLGPFDFSRRMHAIEDDLGRVRSVRNGPRTIDLDLIDFGGQVVDTPELTLPHPRARFRGFVLEPLAELGRLLAVACLALAGASASARPLHLHNEDSTQFWHATPKEHLTEEGARRWVRDIIGPGLTTHFYMCTGGGGYARAAFDSKVNPSVAEVAGRLTRRQDPWDYAGRVKLLRDRGVDVFAIWIAECRRHGVSPWITIRVNDVHGAVDPESPMNSEFIRKHPELRLAKSCFGAGGLDFTKREVRDYLLAFAEENLARYDVDGVEFDWLRHTDCLPEGNRWANRWALTETMRGLRRLADAAAKRRGHPVKTGVRVFTRPRIVERAHGCDVFGWARERLVDVVVPCNAGDGADFVFPYDEWRTRMDAANPDVLVVPGLDEFAFYDWERSRLSPADYAGFADWVRSRGAPGIYTFDLTPHEREGDYPALHSVFKAVHAGIMRDPGAVSRRYPYGLADDRDEHGKWTVYLPRNLHEPRQVSVCVGTTSGVTRVTASVGYRKEYAESPATYELNGVRATATWKVDPKAAFAPDAKFKGAFTAEFPASALRSGVNDLAILPVKPSQDYISAALVEVVVNSILPMREQDCAE